VYKVLPGLLFLAISYGAANAPAEAQLPGTNMGKFVHQPGDNQYTPEVQAERHGAPAPVYTQRAVPRQSSASDSGSSSSAYVPTPKPIRPDISLLPIVADEPVKPAGFPPLPDRLDLPVSSGWTTKESPWLAQAAPRGSSAGRPNLPDISQPTGVHQHYVHYQPGAFQTPQERQQAQPSSGNFVSNSGSMQSAPAAPSSHGYYKAGDYYSVNTKNSAAAVPVSGTVQAIRQLGKEPRLGNDAPAQPEAPASVVVNQSTTEDLSLQDDEFNKQSPQAQNNSGRQMGRTLVNVGARTLYTGAMMGASMARVR
jgi:hypothetical protein